MHNFSFLLTRGPSSG